MKAILYIRLGTSFYQIVNAPTISELINELLLSWDEHVIKQEHGMHFLSKVSKYDGVTCIPCHVDFKEDYQSFYNTSSPLKNIPKEDNNDKTLSFIKHIFQNHEGLDLDYLQLLYRRPRQTLPIPCMICEERSTDNSTFFKWLKTMFENNLTYFTNDNFGCQFNADWANKLLIYIDELLFIKEELTKRIKYRSTTDWNKAESKSKNKRKTFSFLADDMPNFSFHQQPISHAPIGRIEIQKVMSIQHLGLIYYLKSRKIPFSVAKKFCNEVWYQHNGKMFFAVGLKNYLGGWELRNKYYKTFTSPKTFSYINQGHENLIVTQGMFDLLSLERVLGKKLEEYDIIVLNSVAFASRIASHIKDYKNIKLYLDNDAAGTKATEHILKNFPQSTDCRGAYNGFKNANEKLISWG